MTQKHDQLEKRQPRLKAELGDGMYVRIMGMQGVEEESVCIT